VAFGFVSPIRDFKANINCTQIWLAFQNAYIGRDPLTINEESYGEYFAAADQTIDRALFWTGSDRLAHNPNLKDNTSVEFYDLDLVHVLSDDGQHYWTLEDTLWGYLVNSLTFCGATLEQQQSTGAVFNYTFCPTYGTNGSNVFFWNAASRFFAQHAHNNINMVARASMRGGQPSYIYRSVALGNYNTAVGIFPSIFATWELPNINPSGVLSFTIWVVPSPDLPQEVCGSSTSSTNALINDLVARGISRDVISCQNNPPVIEFARCADKLASGYDDPGLACLFDPSNPYVLNRSELGPPGSVAALVIMMCLVVALFTFVVTFYCVGGRWPWRRWMSSSSSSSDSSSSTLESTGRKTKNSVI